MLTALNQQLPIPSAIHENGKEERSGEDKTVW